MVFGGAKPCTFRINSFVKKMTHTLFQNRTAALATIHAKEKIIAPIFEQYNTGLQIRVASVDTDSFGTFTGETERKGSQTETARMKCMAAIEQTGLSIGIASEGAFGPHPSIPFVAANVEIVMLKDTKLSIEVCGQHLTSATNFSSQKVNSVEAALEFADSAGFPSHGIIVRGNPIVKGIHDYETLTFAVSQALAQQPLVQIETDMRAMHNPTRCRAIAAAAADLAERLMTLCPHCRLPGFGRGTNIQGLPCNWCGLPTQEAKGYWMECPTCQYREEVLNSSEQYANPACCMFCNP
jgi:hypothetical protein